MKQVSPFCSLLFISVIALLQGCGEVAEPANPPMLEAAVVVPDVERISALRAQLESLKQRAQQVQDANDIKRLQRAYGYYVEEALWDEVVNLFADDATLEMARDGVYIGKERIRAYFYALGNGQQGLREGQLNEQLQLMPVVTLNDDGRSAKARWRNIMLLGQFGENAFWGEGPFENEYVKENGIWKISKLWWQQAILVPYAGGWAKNADANSGIWVSDTLPPDAPPTDDHGSWPQTYLPPFSFANPVATYRPTPAPDVVPATGAQQ
ncbi:MAG: nuclear transport factor 2 family protein [Pseudomonadota bacterium]